MQRCSSGARAPAFRTRCAIHQAGERRGLSADLSVHHQAHIAAGHGRSRHQRPGGGVQMIGTKAMLAAREDFHPALINLLIDAARTRPRAGRLRKCGRVPGRALDLRVSPCGSAQTFRTELLYRYLLLDCNLPRARHHRRGPIGRHPGPHRELPAGNHALARRSRIYRWYGELALLERDVATRRDALPSSGGCRTSIASRSRSKASRHRRSSRARRTRCASTSRWSGARFWQRAAKTLLRPTESQSMIATHR
jgi:hypothetical protein